MFPKQSRPFKGGIFNFNILLTLYYISCIIKTKRPNHPPEYLSEPFPDSIVGCYDLIEYHFDNPPKDKRTAEYTLWKNWMNTLIRHCNYLTYQSHKIKVYKPIE